MKSGQGHGPAKKKFVAGWGAGIVTGIVLVAVLMPFPLAAAVDRTEGLERAGTVTVRDVFSMTAAMQFLVAQARDTEPQKIPQAAPGEAPRKPAAGAAPAPNDASQGWGPTELGVGDRIQDWLARANREFQTTIIRRLSTPPPGGVNDDEIARKLEEVKKQEALAAAAKRAEDERKAAEAERAKQAHAEQAKQTKLAKEHRTAGCGSQAPPGSARSEPTRPHERLPKKPQQKLPQKTLKKRKIAAAPPPRTATKIELGKSSSRRSRSRDADRRSVDAVRQPAPEVRGVYRAPTNVSAAGPVVRRWIWRAGNSRCSHAGRRVMLPGRYTVRAGDSLWRISRRHYHSGLLYAKIYRANRSVFRNPDLIYPCQSIFVPRRH